MTRLNLLRPVCSIYLGLYNDCYQCSGTGKENYAYKQTAEDKWKKAAVLFSILIFLGSSSIG